MNRRERRKAASLKRTLKLDRVVAVHEAGHAVARVLSADEMGFPPEIAIDHVEIGGSAATASKSPDGTLRLEGQAITRGPMFSHEIMCHIDRGGVMGFDDLREVIVRAQTAGADVLKWVKVKALIVVSGPVAEAKLRGVHVDDIFSRHEAEKDKFDLVSYCKLAALESDAIGTVAQEAICLALALFDRPEVWRAVLAVADALPREGRLEGAEVVRIVEHCKRV